MQIKITHYGYLTKNGQQIYGLFCGHLPTNVTILEEREVLLPDEGNILVNKITGEELSAVYLKNCDSEENYTEKEIEDDYIDIN